MRLTQAKGGSNSVLDPLPEDCFGGDIGGSGPDALDSLSTAAILFVNNARNDGRLN